MNTVILEGRIELTFDEGWSALKWDATPPADPPPYRYREGIGKLQGDVDGRTESTKAVDVIASPRDPSLLLMEIKDFRTDRGPGGGPRALAFGARWRELPLEVALKVRDSLAGVAGVLFRAPETSVATWMRPARDAGVYVFAVVAQDPHRPEEPTSVRKARDHQLYQDLRRRLAWLTREGARVRVVDPFATTLPPQLHGVSFRSV